jgi:hypothetical protein
LFDNAVTDKPPLLEKDIKTAVRANADLVKAGDLLRYYSFEMGSKDLELQLYDWLMHFPAAWIAAAVIEALYQGRYKGVSVEQILRFWQRRQQPQMLYGYDFEQLVCQRLPRTLQDAPTMVVSAVPTSAIAELASQMRRSAPELSPMEALSRAIQRSIPLRQSVDAVVDQAEAKLSQASDAGKRQVLSDGRSQGAADKTPEALPPSSSTVIPQFTPKTTDLDSKLRGCL